MLVDVLEGIEIRVRALGDLAQQQAAVAFPDREMAAFPIRRRAPRDLHHERRTGLREERE